jgi:hypothetical protein
MRILDRFGPGEIGDREIRHKVMPSLAGVVDLNSDPDTAEATVEDKATAGAKAEATVEDKATAGAKDEAMAEDKVTAEGEDKIKTSQPGDHGKKRPATSIDNNV